MITGEIKNRIDSIWDTFWTGGITNSLTILEQMTYLFFMNNKGTGGNIFSRTLYVFKPHFLKISLRFSVIPEINPLSVLFYYSLFKKESKTILRFLSVITAKFLTMTAFI